MTLYDPNTSEILEIAFSRQTARRNSSRRIRSASKCNRKSRNHRFRGCCVDKASERDLSFTSHTDGSGFAYAFYGENCERILLTQPRRMAMMSLFVSRWRWCPLAKWEIERQFPVDLYGWRCEKDRFESAKGQHDGFACVPAKGNSQ